MKTTAGLLLFLAVPFASLAVPDTPRPAGPLAQAETGAPATGRLTRLWPRSGAIYFTGDSQTDGYNFAGRPYTNGSHLLDAYKWTHQFSAFSGLPVGAYLAIGGSRISWNTNTGVNNQTSHFNQLGQVPHDWSGIHATMPGWNNLAMGMPWNAEHQSRFQNAVEAMIARLLIDDWGGITVFGWTRTLSNGAAPSSIPGWATTRSTNEDSRNLNRGSGACLPFPYPAPGARYRIKTTADGTITFQVGAVRAVALFFETDPDGGPFEVLVNGLVRGAFTNQYIAPAGDVFPQVVWLENVPARATILIRRTVAAGNLYFLAFGTVSLDVTTVNRRLVLVSSVTGNPANGRTPTYLRGAYNAALAAVAAFGQNYPVAFVDNQVHWVTARDQEPADISHITDLGNAQIALQFSNPFQPPPAASLNVIRLP